MVISLSIVRSFAASGQKLQIHIICYVSSVYMIFNNNYIKNIGYQSD